MASFNKVSSCSLATSVPVCWLCTRRVDSGTTQGLFWPGVFSGNKVISNKKFTYNGRVLETDELTNNGKYFEHISSFNNLHSGRS